jgi:hypothetical protein
MAHPGALVVDIAGETTLMNIRSSRPPPAGQDLHLTTNMGMVRQWRNSCMKAAIPKADGPLFHQACQAYGRRVFSFGLGAPLTRHHGDDQENNHLRASSARAGIACGDSIGEAHNEMLLPGDDEQIETAINVAGKMLV